MQSYDNMKWDGSSFKDVFINGAETPRTELVHELKFGVRMGGIIRHGDYKLAFRILTEFGLTKNHTIPEEGRVENFCAQIYLDFAIFQIFKQTAAKRTNFLQPK